ncbi:hypothetical protein H4S02_013262, partial [Coemansia sp. RSA 2611]
RVCARVAGEQDQDCARAAAGRAHCGDDGRRRQRRGGGQGRGHWRGDGAGRHGHHQAGGGHGADGRQLFDDRGGGGGGAADLRQHPQVHSVPAELQLGGDHPVSVRGGAEPGPAVHDDHDSVGQHHRRRAAVAEPGHGPGRARHHAAAPAQPAQRRADAADHAGADGAGVLHGDGDVCGVPGRRADAVRAAGAARRGQRQRRVRGVDLPPGRPRGQRRRQPDAAHRRRAVGGVRRADGAAAQPGVSVAVGRRQRVPHGHPRQPVDGGRRAAVVRPVRAGRVRAGAQRLAGAGAAGLARVAGDAGRRGAAGCLQRADQAGAARGRAPAPARHQRGRAAVLRAEPV